VAYFEVRPQYHPRECEENYENVNYTTGNESEIGIGHIPSTSPQCYQ